MADWNAISALMQRRGPDDSGLWSDQQHCTLVFRRLAILDLSPTGHQPMLSQDEKYAIVFNGELYNFRELRRELETAGRRFRSSGDTEVVLNALIHWGESALERFNGMFALAFYNREKKELLLARDHAGIKPLYYLQSTHGIAFGSQYNQLLAHPWSHDKSVSADGLGLYLRLGAIPAPYALLQDSHMLAAGSWLKVNTSGDISSQRYYRFPMWQPAELSGAEAFAAVDQAIDSAVRRQMVSDVPLGAFLSGGIDSPLVTAKASRFSEKPLHTFTIGTNDPATDESADADHYARQFGTIHTHQACSPQDALALLDDVIEASSEPFGDYSIFPTMLVSKLARHQHTVMLSGDGGDELFWGYPGRALPILRNAADFGLSGGRRWLAWLARRLNRQRPYGHLRQHANIGDWQLAALTRLPQHHLNAIFPGLPALPTDYHEYDYSGHALDETAQWLRWNEFTNHLSGVLLKVDRASMHQSLEVRVPLLDREVIDTALRVDWQSCLDLDSGLGKMPLRESLKRYSRHQTQTKKGFEVPMKDWLKNEFKPYFQELLLSQNQLLGLELDSRALARLYTDHCTGRANYAWGLWPLLSLALWERHHFNRR